MGLNARFHLGQRWPQSVLLGRTYLYQLASPGQQSTQDLAFLIGQRSGSRLDPLGEQGQGVSIQPVGLGKLTQGLGEVPHLAWVDYCQWDTLGCQGGYQGQFQTSCGLKYYQSWPYLLEALDYLVDACIIVLRTPLPLQ